jgi:hypothetical protein
MSDLYTIDELRTQIWEDIITDHTESDLEDCSCNLHKALTVISEYQD